MTDESPEDQALDASYRRLASPGAPAQATRRAILAQARALAAERALSTRRIRAAVPWARPALFGALAAGAVAGLIIVPRWKLPVASTAPQAALAPAAPAEIAALNMPSDALPTPRAAARPAAAPPPAPLRLEEPAAPAVPAPQAAAPGTTRALGRITTAIANTPTAHVAAAPLPPGEQLRHAAEAGDLVQLEAFSRGQTDLNAPDARGRTALMLATLNGRADAVAALLVYGADPRAADAQGVTPLAAARAAGNVEIVAIFARYGLH
jgi:Ankyrin repeats (3 copies)